MVKMNYAETIEFLFSQLPAYHRIGKAAYKNNLDNTIALDTHLGHPHLKYKSLHVAGTNGKGSVSNLAASVLQEAGFRTGLYTSPHLKDFRERIRINGEMIPEEIVTAFVGRNIEIIRSVQPSFFEMTFALATEHFANEKVDVAVIEVGLGGRLDSTNIITPLVSLITNIGHDHMDLLGDTLEKVASEKAGIIKPGVPVVIGETQQEVMHVFTSSAKIAVAPISFADKAYECTLGTFDPVSGQRDFRVKEIGGTREHPGEVPLGGDYQARNIVSLFEFMKQARRFLTISDENILNGIRKVRENTGFSGRWQVLGRNPLVICDTGHNREGLDYITRQLRDLRPARLHIVVGFVSDKDLSQVLPLLPKDAEYYFTKASVLRALDEKVLMEKAAGYGLYGRDYGDVITALDAARANAGPDDVVFVGGSTFVVGDL